MANASSVTVGPVTQVPLSSSDAAYIAAHGGDPTIIFHPETSQYAAYNQYEYPDGYKRIVTIINIGGPSGTGSGGTTTGNTDAVLDGVKGTFGSFISALAYKYPELKVMLGWVGAAYGGTVDTTKAYVNGDSAASTAVKTGAGLLFDAAVDVAITAGIGVVTVAEAPVIGVAIVGGVVAAVASYVGGKIIDGVWDLVPTSQEFTNSKIGQYLVNGIADLMSGPTSAVPTGSVTAVFLNSDGSSTLYSSAGNVSNGFSVAKIGADGNLQQTRTLTSNAFIDDFYDSNGHLASASQLNIDGSHSNTAFNTGGSTTLTYNSQNQTISQSRQNIDGSYEVDVYNPQNGKLVSQKIANSDGSYTLTYDDPATGAWLQSRSFDKDGNLSAESNSPGITQAQFVANLANTIADQIITQFLIKNNLPASLGAEAFTHAGIQTVQNYAAGATTNLSSFADNLAVSLTAMGGGLLGSDLGASLFKSLGLPVTIGSAVGNALGTAASIELTTYIAQDLGLTGLSSALSLASYTTSLATAFESAGFNLASSYVATKLEHVLEPNGNPQDAVAGGAIGSVIGGAIGSFIPVVGTILGSVIGNFIGTLIGGLFGSASVGPNAIAGDIFNPTTQTFSMTVSGQDKNGPLAAVQAMDNAKVQIENAALKAIGGKVTNVPTLSSLGYIGGHYFFVWGYVNGPQNSFPDKFATAQAAIDFGVIQTLKALTIVGGNPYMVYALRVSDATTADGLLRDLNVAADYSKYVSSPLAFDVAIALSSDPTQLQQWQAEYARAQQLGLTQFPTNIINKTLTVSAADLIAKLDQIQYLVTGNLVTSIKLSDSGTANLAVTSAQFSAYVAELSIISSPHAVTLSDVSSVGKVIVGTGSSKVLAYLSTPGSTGNDTFDLTNGAGTVVVGGGGSDIYKFYAGTGHVLIENSWSGTLAGTLQLLNFNGSPKYSYIRVGNDLVLDFTGTSDRITLQNWFSNPNAQLATINQGGSTVAPIAYIAFKPLPLTITLAATYSTAAYYNAKPQIAQDAFLLSQLSGAMSLTFADTAAHIVSNAANLALLASQGRLQNIHITDAVAPVLQLTVDQLKAGAAIWGKIDSNYSFSIIDSAVNISANYSSLIAVQARLTSILPTDQTPILWLSAAQGLGGQGIFSKVGTSTTLGINDSALNITANLDGLQALSKKLTLSSILLTDASQPELSVTIAQLVSDATVLSKIVSPFTVVVSGANADFIANLAVVNNLLLQGKLEEVHLTDTGAVSNLTAASAIAYAKLFAKVSSPLFVSVLDAATNIQSVFDGLGSLAYQGLLISIGFTSASPVLTLNATQAVQTDIAALSILKGAYSLIIADTAANVSSNLSGIEGLSSQTPLTKVTVNYTTGNSLIVLFNPIAGTPSRLISYSGANGTGVTTKIIDNFAVGGSQVQTFNSTTGVTTNVLSYSGANGTGTVINTTYNLAVGNDGTLNISNSTINLGANSSATINGARDIITVGGASSTLVVSTTSSANNISVTSNQATVNDGGSNDVVILNGTGDKAVINGAASNITLGGVNDWAQLAGTSEYASLTSAAAQINVSGAGNTINLSGTGEYAAVSGDNNQAVVAGSGNNINVTGAKGWVGLQGDHNNAVLNGSGNQVAVSGTNAWTQLAGASEYALLTGNGAQLSLTGTGNGAELKGTGEYALVFGNNDQIVVSGSNNNVNVTGTGGWIGLQGDADNTILSGTGNQIALTGTHGWVQLSGTNEIAIMTGAGNVVLVSGSHNMASFGAGGGQSITATGTSDVYNFAKGSGADTISNGVSTNKTATNELDFGAGIASNQLWLQRSGNNLVIDVMGTKDSVTVSNWFTGTANQLQTIKTADGNILDTKVSQLVQAMASYSSAHAAFNPTSVSVLPGDAALQQSLTASWHR